MSVSLVLAFAEAGERPSDSRDLQEKLSLLTRGQEEHWQSHVQYRFMSPRAQGQAVIAAGMHLLSEQIHSKTEELKAVEDLQKDANRFCLAGAEGAV